MSDDTLWTKLPPRPCKSRSNERLWSLWHKSHAYAAQLRYHNEYGVEAQILRDGDVLAGYRSQTRTLAVQWAEEERELREARSTRGERPTRASFDDGVVSFFKENGSSLRAIEHLDRELPRYFWMPPVALKFKDAIDSEPRAA